MPGLETKKLYLITLALLFSSITVFSQQQLSMIIEISHHGATSPRYSDPWYDDWDSLGDIIPAGIRQHYMLGREIQSRYSSVIPTPYNPNSVYIRAIDSNRTIESAYSQAYALFTVGDEVYAPQFNSSYNQTLSYPPLNGTLNQTTLGFTPLPNNYTPVAVHTENPHLDHLLRGFSGEACPYQSNLTAKQILALYAKQQAFITQFRPLVENAVKKGWIKSSDSSTFDALYETANLYEVLVSDYIAGVKDIPMQPGSQAWVNYEYLYVMLQNYLFYNDPLQPRLASMNLLHEILGIFTNKTKGLRNESFVHYSARDNNILSILTAFNQTSPDCFYSSFTDPAHKNLVCTYPSYASALFFELWSDPNNATNSSIKVIYNDYVLYLCGKPTCDLNSFSKVITAATGGLQYTDFLRICYYGMPEEQGGSGSGFQTFLIILAVALFVGLFYFTKKELYDPYMEINQQNQQAAGNYARQQ